MLRLAYFLTMSALFLNNVSTPPIDCCKSAPSEIEDEISLPRPATPTATAPIIAVDIALPSSPPTLVPALVASGANCFAIDPCVSSAEGDYLYIRLS